MHQTASVLAMLLLWAAPAHGQADPTPATQPAPPASSAATAATWNFSAAAYAYFVPDDSNYLQPAFTADRGRLHLEVRYNYEDRDTASAWVGCNFGGGESVEWEFTPMLGGVFGNTAGVAPGYRGSVSWRIVELYSEGEYVFDAGSSSDSFFYNWSELGLAPAEWVRMGLVTQRTRAYDTERDVERGLFVGVSHRGLGVTLYVFDPDVDEPTVVVAAAVEW